MYLIRGKHNLNLFKSKYPNISLSGTIGNFDGLHLGHQAILNKIKQNASKFNGKTIVFFTEPHAAEYFSNSSNKNKKPPPRISPWREKFELLKKNEIDFACFLKFNDKLRTMSPGDFISEILDSINLVSFTVGDDFRFGENTETIIFDGQRVSSSRIREELLNNNFKNAEKLLGRPYTFSGKIVHGQHLGKTINIPTANIWLPNQRLPIKGVYAVKCKLDDLSLNGIANMGIRPTVGGEKPVLEVHLFEFNENIYSQRIRVKFVEKIRDEKKFDNLDMLKSQIQKDISIAKNILLNSNDS